jgi:hypothetical protein
LLAADLTQRGAHSTHRHHRECPRRGPPDHARGTRPHLRRRRCSRSPLLCTRDRRL